ncbi:MAG: hypothetical protein ACJA0B_000673 [Alcanivorax borkumensis]|jgi:hypothetical protein
MRGDKIITACDAKMMPLFLCYGAYIMHIKGAAALGSASL